VRVFIANRGEVAVRIIRTCRSLGHDVVLGVSAADRDSLGARQADRAVCLGPPHALASYLSEPAVVHAAVATGCDAVHPGYGFLSEKESFARSCREAGLVFVGPRPEHLARLGDKLSARRVAERAGVPVVPGGEAASVGAAREQADRIGYPVLVKAAFGGGGRGMQRVAGPAALPAAYGLATAEAGAAFGNGTVFLERYVARAKHVEVQVARDTHGTVVHLGERDCSVQHRYQKVVEETPCAVLDAAVRSRMCGDAMNLVDSIGYEGIGTVEFIVDLDTQEYWFLEVNPRLQVEHPVTEMVTGVDLVALQFLIASGGAVPAPPPPHGHAIECRVTAQDPDAGLRPSPGRITAWDPPGGTGVRVDSHGYAGYLFPPFYDALLAKLVVARSTRAEALAAARSALDAFTVEGIRTNIPLLRRVLDAPAMQDGTVTTDWLTAQLEEVSVGG
jgi:acetyl-CoA carboxylase, biotin carboxylase subunit